MKRELKQGRYELVDESTMMAVRAIKPKTIMISRLLHGLVPDFYQMIQIVTQSPCALCEILLIRLLGLPDPDIKQIAASTCMSTSIRGTEVLL